MDCCKKKKKNDKGTGAGAASDCHQSAKTENSATSDCHAMEKADCHAAAAGAAGGHVCPETAKKKANEAPAASSARGLLGNMSPGQRFVTEAALAAGILFFLPFLLKRVGPSTVNLIKKSLDTSE